MLLFQLDVLDRLGNFLPLPLKKSKNKVKNDLRFWLFTFEFNWLNFTKNVLSSLGSLRI